MEKDNYNILLAHLLDDDLSEEQGQQLLDQLERDPERLQDVLRHLELWELYSQEVCVQRSAERFTDSWDTRLHAAHDEERFVQDLTAKLENDKVSNQERIQEIERHAQKELETFLSEQETTAPVRRPKQHVDWNLGVRARNGVERLCDALGTGVKIAKFAAVFLAVALAIPTTVRYVQARRIVGTLQDSVDAQWRRAPKRAELQRGWLDLRQGFARIQFKSGAEALLQAPCRLRLESAKTLFLERGMLAIKVSEPAEGFLVRTPNSTINDLGTEFGVVVREDGQTETQVYEGKVELALGDQAQATQRALILEPGEASGFDSAGQRIAPAFKARRFTRALPDYVGFGIPGRRVDLSDVLVGGSGFGTGDPNQMVDIRTGLVSDLRHDSANPGITGQGGFASASLPCVDYLFMADGGEGPIQVSSRNHRFGTCPDTDGQAYPYVSNRGMLRHIPGVIATQVINGRAYGTRTHPAIAMHANAGITFDLQALRDMLPGASLKRFSALCGMSETAGIAVLRESGRAALHRMDFWVLVDGTERFRREGLQAQSGGVDIRLDLQDSDRFLTLMVTDGGDGSGYDWGAFAMPALELE